MKENNIETIVKSIQNFFSVIIDEVCDEIIPKNQKKDADVDLIENKEEGE